MVVYLYDGARRASRAEFIALQGYVEVCPAYVRQPTLDGIDDLDGCPEDDVDGDGISDENDECVRAPETRNGWRDADGCPDTVVGVTISVASADPAIPLESAVVTLDGAGVEVLAGEAYERVLPPGTVHVTATAEGFRTVEQDVPVPPVGAVSVPLALEPIRYGTVRVRLVDPAGRPLEGWVRGDVGPALVAPTGLSLPAPAGPVALRAASAGYRPRVVTVEVPRDAEVKAVVTLEPSGLRQDGSRIETDQEIAFPLDSAEPTPESEPPLAEIAALLLGDPTIELLRVEGHADSLGSSRYNVDLSRRRAAAVVARLVALGVAPERLEAIGSGESVPGGGARRAVSFTVLIWADEGPAGEQRAEPG